MTAKTKAKGAKAPKKRNKIEPQTEAFLEKERAAGRIRPPAAEAAGSTEAEEPDTTGPGELPDDGAVCETCTGTGYVTGADGEQDGCPDCQDESELEDARAENEGEAKDAEKAALEPAYSALKTDWLGKKDAVARAKVDRGLWEAIVGSPVFASKLEQLGEEVESIKESMVRAEKGELVRLQADVRARRELLEKFTLASLSRPLIDAENELAAFERNYAVFIEKALKECEPELFPAKA